MRLPRELAEELALKEGDEIELRSAAGRSIEVVRDGRREEAMAAIRALSRPLQPGYKFDRDEIYDRLGPGSPGREPYD